MNKKILTLLFMVSFVFVLSFAEVSASHSRNSYGRYDDGNPYYHSSSSSRYFSTSYRSGSGTSYRRSTFDRPTSFRRSSFYRPTSFRRSNFYRPTLQS